MKALAVCDMVDDEPSGGFWINQVTDKIFPLPLTDEIVERCAKAAYAVSAGFGHDWDGEVSDYRAYWCEVIRAAMTELVEGE